MDFPLLTTIISPQPSVVSMRQAVIPVKISLIAAKYLYILLQNAADDTNVKLTADQKMTKKCQFFIKSDFLTLFRQFLLKQNLITSLFNLKTQLLVQYF